jgi:hypothetical protein
LLSAPITIRSGRDERLDRRAFAQELGVRCDVEFTTALGVLLHVLVEQPRGADRRGALLHHQLVAVEVLGDDPRHRVDCPRIGAAIGHRRRADGDEHDLRGLERGGKIAGEQEAMLLDVARDHFGQTGLEERKLEVVHPLDLRDVGVHARDRVAEVGQACSGHQAHVAGPHDRNLVQCVSFPKGPNQAGRK